MIMHWPQIAMISLFALEIGFRIARSGQPRTGNVSVMSGFIELGILGWIMYAGGFWGCIQ